jgi:hypothetical protein
MATGVTERFFLRDRALVEAHLRIGCLESQAFEINERRPTIWESQRFRLADLHAWLGWLVVGRIRNSLSRRTKRT